MIFIFFATFESMIQFRSDVGDDYSGLNQQEIYESECPTGTFRLISIITVMMTLFIQTIALTFLTRKVSDAYGLKAETLVTNLIYLAYGMVESSGKSIPIIDFSVGAIFPLATMFLPILTARKNQKRGVNAFQSMNERSSTETHSPFHGKALEAVLDDPKEFDKFREYLKKEFAIESLYFWVSVEKFRVERTTLEEASRLCEHFIAVLAQGGWMSSEAGRGF